MVKIVTEDDPRLKFVPLDQATVPPAGLIEHFKDRYWAVHPTRGLVFWAPGRDVEAAQCNADKSIAAHLKRMYPWAEVRLIPSAFRRINPKDYV